MDSFASTELPGLALEHKLRARPTPLLRISSFIPSPLPGGLAKVVAKLESLRPSGSADDRALSIWDRIPLPPDRELVARLSSGSVLAAAGWARARGRSLRAVVHGTMTHENLETLALWGAIVERAGSRAEAISIANARAEAGALLLPPLDGAAAADAARESLGAELLLDLEQAGLVPFALVAPIGATAAFLGALSALRRRWPSVRGIALCAESYPDVFPELPEKAEGNALLLDADPGAQIEWAPVLDTQAALARSRLARFQGLSASHASAAAVSVAWNLSLSSADKQSVAVALVTATGEREFSLDGDPRLARSLEADAGAPGPCAAPSP